MLKVLEKREESKKGNEKEFNERYCTDRGIYTDLWE
jgi:hypothetical protein